MRFPDYDLAQCGVLTSDQAVGLVGRGVVRGHVRLGRWRQICPGILLTGNGELTPAQQQWVAVLVAGRGALLAGAAAAVAGGIRGIHVGQIPVLIPAVRASADGFRAYRPTWRRCGCTAAACCPGSIAGPAGSPGRRWPGRWSTQRRGRQRTVPRC